MESQESSFAEDLRGQIISSIAYESGAKYSHFCNDRRVEKQKNNIHRNGPAPIEEADIIRKSINKATYGTLDSDLEDLDFEEERCKSTISDSCDGLIKKKVLQYNRVRVTTDSKGNSLASCRALIIYFAKLAKTKDEEERIDLNFVDSLLQNGADINFPDKHGQTPLHEIARGWHPDIAKFALQHNAEINKADEFGRTPLHLAAAVDYAEMVEQLVRFGGKLKMIFQV